HRNAATVIERAAPDLAAERRAELARLVEERRPLLLVLRAPVFSEQEATARVRARLGVVRFALLFVLVLRRSAALVLLLRLPLLFTLTPCRFPLARAGLVSPPGLGESCLIPGASSLVLCLELRAHVVALLDLALAGGRCTNQQVRCEPGRNRLHAGVETARR